MGYRNRRPRDFRSCRDCIHCEFFQVDPDGKFRGPYECHLTEDAFTIGDPFSDTDCEMFEDRILELGDDPGSTPLRTFIGNLCGGEILPP